MANITKFTVYNATYSVATCSTGAAAFTVPLGAKSDSRAYLVIDNDSSVTVSCNVEYGDGIRSVLGDLDVEIATIKTAVIPLNDSMRFKTMTTNSVTVNLAATDTTLTAGELELIKCIFIQG
jgi:hypothetical protein